MARLKKIKITREAIFAIIKSFCNIEEETSIAMLTSDEDETVCMYLFNPDFEENKESIVDIINNGGENVPDIPAIVDERHYELFKEMIKQFEKVVKFDEAEKYRKGVFDG
jgi:hypothetical protein